MHLHWRYPRNKVLTLQDLESQQERTLGSQPVHSVNFTCKDTSTSGSVDYQFKMLNFELYGLYSEPYSIVTIKGVDYCITVNILCLSGPSHL